MSSSSMNSIYGLNRLRITGMNSGLDTDSIISSIMKVEQMKVDKQFKSMTQKEYKRDQIREANKQIEAFRYEFMTNTGGKAAKNVLSAMNFKGYKVTSDDTKARATFSANTEAIAGSHTLNAVKQLAKGAKLTSGEVSGVTSTAKTIGELYGAELGLYTGAVDKEGYALDEEGNRLIDSEDFAGAAGVDAEGKAITSGTLTINDVDIKFNAKDKLSDLINRVNSSKAGVTMGFTQLTKQFSITSNTTGKDSEVIASDTKGLLQSMGFAGAFSPSGSGEYITGGAAPGQDAEAYIDGIRVTNASNTFRIDGVEYSLKKEFNKQYGDVDEETGEVNMGDGSDIGFEVSRDIDRAVGVIKDFVEGYNKLVASLTAMIQEKPDAKYSPLTDEERDALSESQIEKWDAESKKGMLYKDSHISQLLNDMRNAFFQEVEGTGLSMAQIGIAPGASVIDKVYVGTQQDIQIDEEKLRKALESNTDQVIQMFNGGSASSDDSMKTAGLGNRLIKLGNNYKNNTSDIQLASLDYDIDRMDDRLENMKNRMVQQEEMLYKKYAAMETALAKMQSQGNWFASQFGG